MSSSMFLFLAVSGNIYIAADRTSFNVSQSPKEAVVSKGENVTFYCVFPISQDESWVKVYWWKQGENEYQRTSTGSRKRSGRRGKRTWYFELQNVMVQDSGLYLCSLTRKGLPARNGTGSLLKVHAVPTPLKIFAKKHSTTALIIVCETAAFYPKDFSLTWYKNGVEIVLGTQTNIKKNTEGLYEVSSNLTEMQPDKIGRNYTCMVSHVSLNTSAVAVYSISKSNQGSSGKSLSIWVSGGTLAGFVILLLMFVIRTQCRKQERKVNEACLTEADHPEKTGAAAAYYAAVDFKRFKHTPERKSHREKIAFVQAVQEHSSDELSYATLALTGKNNRRICISNTEYAELQRHKHMGETVVVHQK
ncbi:tyrosine-protein phosphatase non-receptor type substrate 1-like [Mobula hypostoma]|uniref:tyrosine-protein phosphatase non-receptor type substrate 1-like n=1 Tax=Mobula hypostoma TaxID=723540 RepID=UPI002FC28558